MDRQRQRPEWTARTRDTPRSSRPAGVQTVTHTAPACPVDLIRLLLSTPGYSSPHI